MPEHTPAPSPHRGVYGFAAYALSLALFFLYVLWALLPTDMLGLHYLPDKYFAILLPVLVLTAITFFIFFIYPAINLAMTADVDDLSTVADVALILQDKSRTSCSWKELEQLENKAKQRCAPKLIANCNYCNGNAHRPNTTKAIDTLRFMDLDDINRRMFAE